MSLIQEAEKAHKLHEQLKEVSSISNGLSIQLAQKLYFLKKNNLYKKAIGEGINTWIDYLKQPEVNITRYRADMLVRIYEFFCIENEFDVNALSHYSMYALNYVSKKRPDMNGILNSLNDSQYLSEKDFKEKYHNDVEKTERTYTYMIMKKCIETGSMEKVHNVLSEDIKSKFSL